MKQLLTFSRQQTFKVCRRQHQFAYEWGIRRENDARALRMGSAWHHLLEMLKAGIRLEDAIEWLRTNYAELPEAYDPLDWSYECETLERLLCAYQWRWQDVKIEYVGNEQSFSLPLVNPATGAASTNWDWAGKIDGIIRLEDHRLSVMEHKLLGEELDSDSPLWKRLRVDHQISLYILAARNLGHDVGSVFYDVTRKPTIKPTAVPILDGNGAKVVLDRDNMRVFNKNGAPRQTASTEDGYALQTRPMTPDEWGEKLTADIQERPVFYFARKEVARLQQDLEECESELWDIQKTIRDAQVNDRHFRTATRETCQFCAFFDMCTTGWQPIDPLPEGFKRVADIHPELSLSTNPTRTSHAAIEPPADASAEETFAATVATAG